MTENESRLGVELGRVRHAADLSSLKASATQRRMSEAFQPDECDSLQEWAVLLIVGTATAPAAPAPAPAVAIAAAAVATAAAAITTTTTLL